MKRPAATANFELFVALPTEVRIRIWQLAFTPHIIRWVRTDDEGNPSRNQFPYSPRQNAVYHVNRESRESISLLAKFVALDNQAHHKYGPSHDYLHLDTAWRELSKPQLSNDPFTLLPFDCRLVGRIMINPNYTEQRMKPGLAFEKLPNLREVLVVADEKSVGLKDKFMLASVYDLRKYFEGAKRQNPKIKLPRIAVGCLGRVGRDRLQIAHSMEDRRQLIAVFDNQAEIKEHLNKVREEESNFLRSTFSQRAGFKLKFRPGYSMESTTRRSANETAPVLLGDIARHGEGASGSTKGGVEGNAPLPLTEDLPSLDELPTYRESIANLHIYTPHS
jgi:hypothetical protein